MDSTPTPKEGRHHSRNRTGGRATNGDTALLVYRPLVEKLLAALGALVTHQLAYLVAGALAAVVGFETAAASDHSHMTTLWALITPAAVLSTVALIVWQLRTLGFRSNISVRSLSGFVVAFFLVQETAEGLIAGHSVSAVVSHPAIAIGVFLAPFVAWVLARLLAGAAELVARWFDDQPSTGFPPSSGRLIPLPVRYGSAANGRRSRQRAPPS